jgi:hypothetical protein
MAGPRGRVEDVDSAFTEPVSVASAESNVHKRVNIGLEDPLLRIQGDPRVEVTVEVRPLQDKRTFPSVPVTVRGGSLEATPSSVKVVLVGPAAALKKIAPSSLRAFVDTAQADAEKKARVTISIEPEPPGVGVDRVEPAAVVLRATRGPR